MTDKNPVVILGAHGCGAPSLASMIGRYGYTVADADGTTELEQSGQSESNPIAGALRSLEHVLGRSHSKPDGLAPLPEGWLLREDVLEIEADLRRVVELMMANESNPLSFGDPRILRFLPLWYRLFESLNTSPAYIFVYRRTTDAIECRAHKDGVSREIAQFLFLREILDFLRYVSEYESIPDAAVRFESLTTDPCAEVGKLAGLMGWRSGDAADVPIQAERHPEAETTVCRNGTDPAWTVETCRRIDCAFDALTRGIGNWRTLCDDAVSLAAEFDKYTRPLINLALENKYRLDATGESGPAKWAKLEGIEPRAPDADAVEFPGLPVDGKLGETPGRSLKICIATNDIVGPIRNGGIGTAYRYVADLLAGAGHDVTILYGLGWHCETGTIEDWISYYADRGIRFVPVPAPEVPNKKGIIGRTTRIAYLVYEWLKHQQYDVVHVSEWRGIGYYCLVAKSLGLAFDDTVFCVKCSSPNLWAKLGGGVTYSALQDAGIAFMERRSVELADVVVSGSLHMLRWMMKHGYAVPRERAYVQPNIMLKSTTTNDLGNEPVPPNAGDGELHAVREIVFFGRLEPRKGIHIFCAALDQLFKRGNEIEKVVFVGKVPKQSQIVKSIRTQGQRWQYPVEFLTDLNQPDALSYLANSGRLAVIPSLLENSSFAIYECLVYGIHFVASDVGGSGELIHHDDRPKALFAPTPSALADKLQEILRSGARRWRPSFDYEENNRRWLNWHAELAVRQGQGDNEDRRERQPLVSVCIAHYERPQFLQHALASIGKQTYKNIEIIVVDDGSSSPETLDYLQEVEKVPEFRDVKVIRQENKYLGASRNTAARSANGEYLLFMDDDNVAKDHEVETFVRAMELTNVDILTCFADEFEHTEYPVEGDAIDRHTPLGASLSVGFFRNCYGDSNAFIRRSAFEALGGFTEEYRIGRDDQELFSRAVLEGLRLEVVPEPLFWYRKNVSGSMKQANWSVQAGQLRVLRPYIESLPAAFQNLLMLALAFYNGSTENQHAAKRAGGRLSRIENTRSSMLVRAVRVFQAAEQNAPQFLSPFFRFIRTWTHR